MCRTINEGTNRFCYNCQTLLQKDESLISSKNQPVYYFEQVRSGTNDVASFRSEKQNLFSIVRPTPTFRLFILIVLMVLAILVIFPVLIVPTYGIIVFIILFFIILYMCLFFLGKIIYFNVYSNKSQYIGKIKLKTNFFNIIPQLKRTNWILADDRGSELSITKFIGKYNGKLSTTTDLYEMKFRIDSNNSFNGISEFEAINETRSKQILIKSSYMEEAIDRTYTRISGNYEITATPDIDVRIVMFFTFLIFMKLLRIV